MATLPYWRGVGERQARRDVVDHPFYRRWTNGELRSDELADYASEYEHAVLATAAAWRRAAELGGSRFDRRAAEAEAQVRLWRAFAKRAGWGGWGAWTYGEDPLPATAECSRAWAGDADRSLAEHLVTLGAIESLSAATCRLKLAGLLDHYGFEDGPATEYLWRQATVDGEKGLATRGWLSGLVLDSDPGSQLEQVDAVHRAYWSMLEEIEARAARA